MADCSSAESVLEAMALIKANGNKIDRFTNGTASQTVQLGTGAATPTLRKLVADAQAVVQEAVDALIPAGAVTAITNAYIDGLFSD